MCGVPSSNIGVISPYRAHLKIIRHRLMTSGQHTSAPSATTTTTTAVPSSSSPSSSSSSQFGGGSGGVEVHTVDKFQGRDKDCIVVSLVRSNPNKNVCVCVISHIYQICLFFCFLQVGDLLRDWRRVNVAFTRAKRKVCMQG